MLKEGDKAPDFRLQGSDGKSHSLKDFKGRRLVLYFYPKDNTPGCTIEAKQFSSNLEEIHKLNAEVAGVSGDDLASHSKFISKCELGILLLSDPSLKMIKEYEAYGNKGIFGIGIIRKTYIIDAEGGIAKIYQKVSALGHAQEVVDFLKGG